jgi:hypothetical protein
MKDDDQKKVSPPLAIDSKFIFSLLLCQSFYDVKQKAQLEMCAPLAITVGSSLPITVQYEMAL